MRRWRQEAKGCVFSHSIVLAHIGSCSVPAMSVLEPTGPGGASRFKSPEALRAVFAAAGADLGGGRPLVGSCGSGLTACILAQAVYIATGKLVRKQSLLGNTASGLKSFSVQF